MGVREPAACAASPRCIPRRPRPSQATLDAPKADVPAAMYVPPPLRPHAVGWYPGEWREGRTQGWGRACSCLQSRAGSSPLATGVARLGRLSHLQHRPLLPLTHSPPLPPTCRVGQGLGVVRVGEIQYLMEDEAATSWRPRQSCIRLSGDCILPSTLRTLPSFHTTLFLPYSTDGSVTTAPCFLLLGAPALRVGCRRAALHLCRRRPLRPASTPSLNPLNPLTFTCILLPATRCNSALHYSWSLAFSIAARGSGHTQTALCERQAGSGTADEGASSRYENSSQGMKSM